MKKLDVFEKVCGISSSHTDLSCPIDLSVHYTNYLLRDVDSFNGCVMMTNEQLQGLIRKSFMDGYTIGEETTDGIVSGKYEMGKSIHSGELEHILNGSDNFCKTIKDLSYKKKSENIVDSDTFVVKELIKYMNGQK